MEVAELKAKLIEINKEIGELDQQRRGVEQQIAELLCPFKVGDRIVTQDIENVTRRWEVSAIRYDLYCGGYNLRGRRLKKNGQPGKTQQGIYSFYGEPKLMTEE